MSERHRGYRATPSPSALTREDWDRRYAGAELLWTAEPNRVLVAEVADMAPGDALDVACGEGRNAVWLAERGWRVTAVDFSRVALAKGRRLAARRSVAVDWVSGDVVEHRPAPAAFDLVVVLYLHLPPAERRIVLGRAARALAPGGTLLVLGHDLRNLTEGHGGPRDPAVLLQPDVVASELSGLFLERAERVRRPPAAGGAGPPAIDALVRARRLGA